MFARLGHSDSDENLARRPVAEHSGQTWHVPAAKMTGLTLIVSLLAGIAVNINGGQI